MKISDKIRLFLLTKCNLWISTGSQYYNCLHYYRAQGVRAGKEIGILEMLFYCEHIAKLHDAEHRAAYWEKIADLKGFEQLREKYPLEPDSPKNPGASQVLSHADVPHGPAH